jgi:uncharacterized SAM-binding protein YcdF (DUF218 family)
VKGGHWRRGVLVALAILMLGGVVARLVVARLGLWLVVEDPPARAAAVVVLAGDFPYRAIEAAAIYREGWAAEVWLSSTQVPARDTAIARLGLTFAGGDEMGNRAVLTRLGVPDQAIRVVPGVAERTVDEVRLVADELRRRRETVVLIVTSKSHTRRVRALWRRVVGGEPRAIVRYAREDPFDPGRWWGNTRSALEVAREVLGLLNAWVGFPVGGIVAAQR